MGRARDVAQPVTLFLWRAILSGILLSCIGLAATAIAVVIEPLPAGLRESRKGRTSLIVEDAGGRRLGEIYGDDFTLTLPVTLAEVPLALQQAVIAAEDSRFFRHRGVDPWAIFRASWQLLRARRIVSGASTITQQLARTVVERPRSFYGKWRELVVSLRIESELSKAQILEAYLNQIPFGPMTRGIGAAVEQYWGKPASALSIAESAALAALPKGPTRYHPKRHAARLLGRRNQILERMQQMQLIDTSESRIAKAEPIQILEASEGQLARHFIRALNQGRFDVTGDGMARHARVTSTLDRALQREVEKLVTDARDGLERFGASAAAVVVVDNRDCELLAYVGSPDFFDTRSLGQNDGCLALRQPGSALKPFVYAAAIEWEGMGPASPLADVEAQFETKTGPFVPRNYDGRSHGLVLLRDALGSSLNVPAVRVAERVGIERLLPLLRDLGFRSLSQPASHYGLAIALGDGEVRLTELAEAYSALARGGLHLPLRVARSSVDTTGRRRAEPDRQGKQILSNSSAWQILEILSDDHARAPSFGRHGVLELPFAVAVKTGTSSNLRDNWAVGVTHEVTVAVWVGNFDGRALKHGTSGVVGAAPLFRSVMEAAMRGRHAAELVPAGSLQPRRICKISGQRPGPDCGETLEVQETLARSASQLCAVHRRIWIDPENGMLADRSCPHAVERVVEEYPEQVADWARAVGRPLAPTSHSPRCSSGPGGVIRIERVRLVVPAPNARYLMDPNLPATQQRLRFEVRVPPGTEWVTYAVDGRASDRIPAPHYWWWSLHPGRHRVKAMTAHGTAEEVEFTVD